VSQDILKNCLLTMLAPIARYCLRNSIMLQDIIELIKIALLKAATEGAKDQGEEASARYLSVMTGVHRKDIARLNNVSNATKPQKNLLFRVTGMWQTDERFCGKSKSPRTLTCGTAESEFSQLVRAASEDLKPGSVLRELERLGMVSYTSRGVRLVLSWLSAKGDAAEGYRMLANDASDLFTAVDQNIHQVNEIPNFHVRTEFDNVCVESVPKIRDWIYREAGIFHRRAMMFISRFDKDVGQGLSDLQGGVRVSLCGFSLVDKKV
jgi:Family of unknown function (DUF6502)